MTEPPAWDQGQVPIGNAHDVPNRYTRAREPIPVRARIAWATGDEQLDTLALAWTRHLVLVQLDDRRHQLRGIWLAASDVHRR